MIVLIINIVDADLIVIEDGTFTPVLRRSVNKLDPADLRDAVFIPPLHLDDVLTPSIVKPSSKPRPDEPPQLRTEPRVQ